jgi:hypothetical protein
VTLDGDRDAHNRSRPLRGGQGTFDRIIANVREVAPLTRIAVGGNFEVDTADSYPALLDFLAATELARQLTNVTFKPVMRDTTALAKRMIPLTAVGGDGTPLDKPLNGACMTSAGTGVNRVCDTCNFVDEKMAFLREETKKHGFSTADGVHMGPCEIHKGHAHTIGPDGSLFACPGFAGEALQPPPHRRAAGRAPPAGFRAPVGLGPVPRLRVHSGLRGRLHSRGAQRTGRHARAQLSQTKLRSGRSGARSRCRARTRGGLTEGQMKGKKTQNPKKNGTLRPWLVDVVVDNLR